MSDRQLLTIQVRLPRGAHELMLDAQARLFCAAERALHAEKRRIEEEHDLLLISKDGKRAALNALKRRFLTDHGITGRHYNALQRSLDGRYDSVRELAKLELDVLRDKIADVRKRITRTEKALSKDRDLRAKALDRKRDGKPATKAQIKALLPDRDAERRKLSNARLRLRTLRKRWDKAEARARAGCPKIVFGGAKLLRARSKIHPNDHAGLARWRAAWDAARHSAFLLIGSKDESKGNQTCQATLTPSGADLSIKLPPGLGMGDRFSLPIPLSGRNRALLTEALSSDKDDRAAIAYRFVKDPDWSPKRRDSAWRVMITLTHKTLGEEVRSVLTGPVLGVDVNADRLAGALVSADGNPIGRWTIPLPLSGKSSDQRRALISEACSALIRIAAAHGAALSVEDLDFAEKKKQISRDKAVFGRGKGYARMLSSLSYARILTDLVRKAQCAGLTVRRVNPAYTSRIGLVNYASRYGASRHEAAAIAIGRRAQARSERVNHIHGPRGRKTTLPAPEDAGRHVWHQWRGIPEDTLRSVRAAGPFSRAAEGRGRAPDPRATRDAGAVRAPARDAAPG